MGGEWAVPAIGPQKEVLPEEPGSTFHIAAVEDKSGQEGAQGHALSETGNQHGEDA